MTLIDDARAAFFLTEATNDALVRPDPVSIRMCSKMSSGE